MTTNISSSTATIGSGLVLSTAGQVPFVIAEGAASVDLDVSGEVGSAGGGGMVKSGPGTMRLSGTAPNTFAGMATVNEGVLLLKKTAGADAIPHDLVIGDGGGGAGADFVRLLVSDQINDASNVTITSSGLLDLNNSSDVIGPLTMTSGSVTTGAGTLALGGKVTTNASASSATISGNVDLGAADREFNVAEGAAAYDLDLLAVLSGGGLVKTGAGTMRLSGSGANIHTGATLVNAGTLVLGKWGFDGAIAKDLVIGDGAGTDTVRLNQDDQISQAPGNTVTINSSGVLDLSNYLDTIYNLTMTGGGQVVGTGVSILYVQGTVTTNASTAAATISPMLLLSTAGQVPFVVADGGATYDLDISGLICGPGGVTKSGPGTLRFDGPSSNVHGGTTTVNEGTLSLAKSGGACAIPGDLVIGDGSHNAWVSLGGNEQITEDEGTTVTVNTWGTLALAGYTETVRNVTFAGGHISGGTLTTLGAYSQSGGSFDSSSILDSKGSFSFTGGTFAGRLINEGDLSIPASFTAGNGVQNFSTITRTTGQSLTSNGAGLDNQGEIILAGGTLDGGGPITNGASISGYGTIGGSGGFTNNAILTVTGGNLAISKTGANLNSGTIDIQSGRQLRLTGGNLSNTGRIDLEGGVVAGTATLSNNAGGAVVGRGTISSPFANNGGMLRAEGGAINVTAAFASSGLIELESGSSLAGGTITNTGAIQGAGSIANAITNNGRIEAVGGTIILGGTVTNAAGGTLAASAGDRVFIGSGLAANAGIISLDGGTFDNNGLALDNTGQISGRGTLRTGALTNHGGIGFSAGITDVYGDVTNPSGGRITVTGGGTATFFDDVVHNAGATFQVSSGCSVVFFGLSGTGSFSGTGTVYIEGDLRPGLSPASVSFDGDLVLGGDADLVAELGGTAQGSQYDHISVGGRLDADGSLGVVLINGFQPHAGDTFDLLDWGTLSGQFDSVALPALGGSLAWDSAALYETGSLTVVPEPCTLALLGLGALVATARRRR